MCEVESKILQHTDWMEKETKTSSGVLKFIDFILMMVFHTSNGSKID